MRTSVSPRHRLLAWLSPDVAGAAAAVEDHDQPPRDSGRGAVHRRLYDDIGDFLFRNGLAPSPANFAVAHAYISGEDWDIAQAVATHLQSGAALLDDDVDFPDLTLRDRVLILQQVRLFELRDFFLTWQWLKSARTSYGGCMIEPGRAMLFQHY